MSVAGIYPVEIFRNIASIDAYGELKTEAKKIVRRIDNMGVDNITALKYAIDVSPSKKFKTFLQGMIGTIQSGSDLHIFLSNIVEKYLEEEFVERKKNLELQAVVAEIFVIAIVAFPLFLVIIISIMSFLIGPPNFTIDTLFIFAFLILPLAYLGFYYIIRSVSFEEIKRYKKTSWIPDVKTLMKENTFGYSELCGLMFDVEIITRVGFCYCRACLSPDNGYPLMQVMECNEIPRISRY